MDPNRGTTETAGSNLPPVVGTRKTRGKDRVLVDNVYGSPVDINAEVFVQAGELFDMFDQLMIAAQRRRMGLLSGNSIRHEFVRRGRR